MQMLKVLTYLRQIKRAVPMSLLLALPIQQAHATTYNVLNNSDTGPGSLRQAILDSNGNVGINTISWYTSGAGLLTLANNLASINANTTLDATNACTSSMGGTGVTIAGAYSMPLSGAVTFANGGDNVWAISSSISGSRW